MAALLSVVSKAVVFGFVMIVLPRFPQPVDDYRGLILVLAATGLVYGSLLAFRQPDDPRDRRLLLAQPDGADHAEHLLRDRHRRQRLDPAVGLPRARLGSAVPARGHGGTAHGRGELAALGGMAKAQAGARDADVVAGVFALAVPGSANFAGEFLILAGVFRPRAGATP